MTNDDLLYRHRLRLFARTREVGVSRACRELGYHRSWYYCEDSQRPNGRPDPYVLQASESALQRTCRLP